MCFRVPCCKNPVKDFCSGDLNVRLCRCVCVLVANGSLDLAARAIVLHAFLFHLAIQGAATEFYCAGKMHRTRDARAAGCHSLVTRVEIHHVTEQSTLARCYFAFRFWLLTGQRCWARLILGRLHDLVLPPNDSKGSTLDPDTVAHEQHSFFFPDNGHGAANAASFGWRNGG